jgi:hypothetical protein
MTNFLEYFKDKRKVASELNKVPCHKDIHFIIKHHPTKTYLGDGGVTQHVSNLGTRWKSVVSFMPRRLYPLENNPQYPLDRRLGGPHSQSGRRGRESNYGSPATILTELMRLPLEFFNDDLLTT